MQSSSQTTQQETIDILNSFLRGELSAVETYSQAITKTVDDPIPELMENEESHRERVAILRREVMNLGGVPAESSGAWGAFTKVIEGGAAMLGRGPALAALEEGEDHGLAQYRRDVAKLSGATRLMIEQDILAEQQRTHDRMSEVQRFDK